jgi:hypothetical protein
VDNLDPYREEWVRLYSAALSGMATKKNIMEDDMTSEEITAWCSHLADMGLLEFKKRYAAIEDMGNLGQGPVVVGATPIQPAEVERPSVSVPTPEPGSEPDVAVKPEAEAKPAEKKPAKVKPAA